MGLVERLILYIAYLTVKCECEPFFGGSITRSAFSSGMSPTESEPRAQHVWRVNDNFHDFRER